MATRFYVTHRNDVSEIAPSFDASWESVPTAVRLRLQTQKWGAPLASSARSETSASSSYDVAHWQLISEPLLADVTISGTVKGIIRALESAAAADLCAQMLIKVVSRDGGTVRGTLLAHDGSALSNEFDAATLTNRKFPRNWSGAGTALSSVAALAGDRIVVEIGWRAYNASSTSYTGTLEIGDSGSAWLAEDETSTIQDNPWIEFSQDLAFETYATHAAKNDREIASDLLIDPPLDSRAANRRNGEPLVFRLGASAEANAAYPQAYRPTFADYAHTTTDTPSRRRPDLGAFSVLTEPRDAIPPTIGSWSPLPGSTIANTDPIVFRVTDNLGEVLRAVVIAEFSTGVHEVVHDGDGFAPSFSSGSTRTPIANGYEFSIVRSPGWAGPGLVVSVFAADFDGNEATPTGYAFTVSDPVLPDTAEPVVSNVTPPEGTPIARTASVFFDVTDDSGIFRRIIVTASFLDGSSEVVHDGDNFATRYAAASSRTVIPDGFRYRVRRNGGWPYGPTIRAFAIDTSGNENG
jgi:hypothetical protein